MTRLLRFLKGDRSDQSGWCRRSVTVKQSGITDILRARGNTVYFHWEVDKSEIAKTRKLASQADVYLCSSNAVTADGKLVNIDGTGNRVASMFYGPDRVYIICGRNKLVENEEQAVERIKNKACPPNARRLVLERPAAKPTGVTTTIARQDVLNKGGNGALSQG